jgi:hypothetical protein
MSRSLVFLFLVCIVGSAIVVGPLGTDATRTSAGESADVTVEFVPEDNVTLERGKFGSGRYHVDAPPAVVHVENVTGTPILRYVVDIPGEWLTASSRYGLGGREGRLSMRPSPVTISPAVIDQERYEAIVSVWVRTGTRERDIVQRRVTVEVES